MPVRNYDFVPFPLYCNTQYINITDFRERMGGYSGFLKLKITALDYLHLGSGFCQLKNDVLFSETLKEQDALVIPGSSLKGAVRQISRAVSDGCIPVKDEKSKVLLEGREQRNQCYVSMKPKKLNACIVCDLYGMMSLASKVRFSDFTSDSVKTEMISVPAQYTPDITREHYKTEVDGRTIHKGYKFYKTNCEPMTSVDRDIIEAVSKGVSFTGTIYFHGLDQEQLELFTYSLGLSRTFSMKLGGYKSAGLGTVKVESTEFIVNGKPEDAHRWAVAYRQRYYEQASYCFDALESIMEYREG